MMPSWSADDRLVAFSTGNTNFFVGENIGNLAPSIVWVAQADGGTPVQISDASHLNVSPVWTPAGTVLYVSSLGGNRDIYSQPIGSDLKPRGGPVRLTTGLNAHTISIDRAGTTLSYSVFNTVANLYSTPIPSSPVIDPPMHQITMGNQTVESGSSTNDGMWIAYDSNINGNVDIFRIPIDGGEAQQLTHNSIDDFAPTWSPDGREIAFHSVDNGSRDIFIMDANGGNLTSAAATASQELAPVWVDANTLIYGVLPDSVFTVSRNPSNPKEWNKPRFLFRSIIASPSPDGTRYLAGAGDGWLCASCPSGGYVVARSGGEPIRILAPELEKVIASPGTLSWSRDSRHAYISVREKDGSSSIWQLAVNGDQERRLVHLRDDKHQVYRTNLDVGANHFYFPIGDRQSDIWTMELKKK
jgi:TolB protein